jgi:hypothetical protein
MRAASQIASYAVASVCGGSPCSFNFALKAVSAFGFRLRQVRFERLRFVGFMRGV